jgi:Na+-transporting NADH:ubiquinone oxidoreductase subunit NqrD
MVLAHGTLSALAIHRKFEAVAYVFSILAVSVVAAVFASYLSIWARRTRGPESIRMLAFWALFASALLGILPVRAVEYCKRAVNVIAAI